MMAGGQASIRECGEFDGVESGLSEWRAGFCLALMDDSHALNPPPFFCSAADGCLRRLA